MTEPLLMPKDSKAPPLAQARAWFYFSRLLHVPRGVLWGLVFWLGLVGIVNVGFIFWNPAPALLNLVNPLLQQKHGSTLDLEHLRVSLLPWGTLVVTSPELRLKQAHPAKRWEASLKEISVPLHLWRLPFGGNTALIGTLQLPQSTLHFQGKAGLDAFSQMLKSFTPDPQKPPSAFSEYIHVHLGKLQVKASNITGIPSLRPMSYDLILNNTAVHWHRTPKELRLNVGDLRLYESLDKRPMASLSMTFKASLIPFIKAFKAGATNPNLKSLWHAFHEEGQFEGRLSLGEHHPFELGTLQEQASQTFANGRPQLELAWHGKPIFNETALRLKASFLKEPQMKAVLIGQWPQTSPKQSGMSLEVTSLQIQHPQGDFAFKGMLSPQWQASTPLKNAWQKVGWQGKGRLNVYAQAGKTGLNSLLSQLGYAWEKGHLQGDLTLKGQGANAQASFMTLNTAVPLDVRFLKPIQMGNVAFPKNTHVTQFTLKSMLTPQTIQVPEASTRLAVNPKAKPVLLKAQGVFHLKNKTLTIAADSPLLTAEHLSAFLRQNPHLIPEPYLGLLSASAWQGGTQHPVYTQDTGKKTLSLHTQVEALFPHPRLGKALPLRLNTPVSLENSPQDQVLRVGNPVKKQLAQIQVAQSTPIQGAYLIHIPKQQQSVQLHMPTQPLTSLMAWANALGTGLPQQAFSSVSPQDTIGVSSLNLEVQQSALKRLNLQKALLRVKEVGQINASADCQRQCDWQSMGDLNLPKALDRSVLKFEDLSLLQGNIHWDLKGTSLLENFKTQALLGNATLEDLTLRYKTHSQLLKTKKINMRAMGLEWQLQSSPLEWGPLLLTLEGEGNQGIAKGNASHFEAHLNTVDLADALASIEEEDRSERPYSFLKKEKTLLWKKWWQGLNIKLPERVNPTGNINVDVLVDNNKPHAKVKLEQAGGFFPSMAPSPFSQVSGVFEYGENNQVTLSKEGLKGYYGLSPWDASELAMTATPQGASMNGRFILNLHPRELNQLMAKSQNKQMTRYNLNTHATVDAQLQLPKWNLTHPNSEGVVRLQLDVEPIESTEKISQNSTEVSFKGLPAPLMKSHFLLEMKQGDWELTDGQVYPLGLQEPIFIRASLDSPNALTHLFSSTARIWTPTPLQIKNVVYNQQHPYSQGTLDCDVAWTKANGSPHGNIAFTNLISPLLDVKNFDASVHLAENETRVHIENFETTQGSHLSWQAQMDLPQPLPFQFKESHMHSTYWDFEDLTKTLIKQVAFWSDPFKNSEAPVSHWIPQHRMTYPFELRNSLLTWDMGVFQNIAVEQGQGLINVYQNGLVQLEDTRFKIVDGDLLMALTMDPFNNNAVTLKLQAKNVPANPVFYGLTGVQQLVIGKLNGGFELGTSGSTNDDFLRNASGKAYVEISEGRMPELVTVGNILSKVSIVRGGLLNLDLSDLGSFLKRVDKNSPEISETYKTYFHIVDGLFLTNSLHTFGKRMNLNVKGSMNLLSQQSNMMIRADIASNTKSMNPLQFNLKKVLRYMPVIGRLPNKDYGFIDFIPVLGYIPAFGFYSQDTNMFYVRVHGKLDNPKDFELPQWINGEHDFNQWTYRLETPPRISTPHSIK
jgi:hypothetical protein